MKNIEIYYYVLSYSTGPRSFLSYPTISGVARGVAKATPIIQFLFNKFGQNSGKKNRIYCWQHQFQNPTYLPAHLAFDIFKDSYSTNT